MANWEKRLLVLLLLFHLSISGFSQFTNEKNTPFFNYLYNFEFDKADSLISTIDSVEQSSEFSFLKAHYMRWYYLPIHNQDDSILNYYKKYLRISENLENSDEVNYTQINNALLSAEYNYNQGSYYKAFQNGSFVYDEVKDNLETEPRQIELKFLASLYHYYYQYYKTENSVYGAMMWFFKEGHKETGLKWLEEVAEQESIVRTEALIYLSHIYLRLENNPDKAYYYAEKLHQLFPGNLKFHELMIESSMAKNRQSELVVALIHKLNEADKIYFKKYGVCYDAIFKSKYGNQSKGVKLVILEDALNFIQKNGGGSHLSSILYFQLYELTSDTEYLKQKNKLEQYKYVHTGYQNNQSNYLESAR